MARSKTIKTSVFNNHREKNLKNKSFPDTHLIKANVDTDCHQELTSVQRKTECIESLHSRDNIGKPHVGTPTPTKVQEPGADSKAHQGPESQNQPGFALWGEGVILSLGTHTHSVNTVPDLNT